MFDTQPTRRTDSAGKQATSKKSNGTKHPLQRTTAPTPLPAYTQLMGTQPASGLRLGTAAPSPQHEEHTEPIQKKENNTGLPDTLKAGVENLSGISMDDVHVHYNSSKPAEVQALAYTQGTEIHVGPGQERHLAHEAWHVVQQKQGRVRPTMQMKGVGVNDDVGLEREADVMGERSNAIHVHNTQDRRSNLDATIRASDIPSMARSLVSQPTSVDHIHPVQRYFVPESGSNQELTDDEVRTILGKLIKSGELSEAQANWIMEHNGGKSKRVLPNWIAAARGKKAGEVGVTDFPRKAPPFPFRFARQGEDAMEEVQDDSGGIVLRHKSQKTDIEGQTGQSVVAVHTNYSSLQQGSKRAISQVSVVGISPNVAAQELKLPEGKWEWLHLVAFSIRPTHIEELSGESFNLIQRTDQPQQITENLVLGTAEANTVMLIYETIIKDIYKKHPHWQLQLWVLPVIEEKKISGISIRVAETIKYHWMFLDDRTSSVYGPVILEFNTLSHQQPPVQSFKNEAERFLSKHPVPVPAMPQGIATGGLHQFPHK